MKTQNDGTQKTIGFKALEKTEDNLGLSSDIYDKFFADINRAIGEFNSGLTTAAPKVAALEALRKMQEAIRYVDLHALPETLATAQSFHDTKNSLFTEIKRAYAEYGVSSLSKADDPLVAQILSDMSPEKADRLMEILLKDRSKSMVPAEELSVLYPSHDTSPEAAKWREFLQTHTIKVFGGVNSKNFKVTNNSDGSVKVLKVDCRFNEARNVEQHLRRALGDVFMPIYADRQVKGKAPDDKMVSRTLLVTDLCASGSVFDHSKETIFQGNNEAYLGAGDIMGQMTQVFIDIQKANCMFPESKLTNSDWLVDPTGKIRLTGTKSFSFTDGGKDQIKVPGNESIGTNSSVESKTSELQSPPDKAESLHASLLGRNIYAYLTDNEWPNDDNILNGLNQPIFNGPFGQEYKKLIEGLVTGPAENRMSLAKAKTELRELGNRVFDSYKTGIIALAKKLDKPLGLRLDVKMEEIIESDINTDLTRETALLKINASLTELDTVIVEAEKLQKRTGVDFIKQVREIIESGIPTDLTRDTRLSEFHESLNTLQFAIDKCYLLIEKIRSIQIFPKLVFDPKVVQDKMQDKIHGASNPRDMITALKNIEAGLTEELEKATELKQKYDEFCQLKQDIEKLKIKDNDTEMNKYLDTCDEKILTDGKPNKEKIVDQIVLMKGVQSGLEKAENKEVRKIIGNYDKQKKEWFSRNMDAKARMIEGAMASIPIEERAKLLESQNPGVTNLFKALAWHRINPFANEVNKGGQIVVSRSADTFQKFKVKFQDTIGKRTDVIDENKLDGVSLKKL